MIDHVTQQGISPAPMTCEPAIYRTFRGMRLFIPNGLRRRNAKNLEHVDSRKSAAEITEDVLKLVPLPKHTESTFA